MFFTGHGRDHHAQEKAATESLAIFGSLRSRRGCELKVLSAVESKEPGLAKMDFDENRVDGDDAFGSSYRVLASGDISYALGKRGATRKKLAAASGCIVEYVGSTVCYAGTAEERARAARVHALPLRAAARPRRRAQLGGARGLHRPRRAQRLHRLRYRQTTRYPR